MPAQKNAEEAVEVAGLHANHMMLALTMEMIGKEVSVMTRDGITYSGIFIGCSSEFSIGLQCAHEVRPGAILWHKDELIPKLQFDLDDFVCISVPAQDEKIAREFLTDRVYQDDSANLAEHTELQEWEADDGDAEEVGAALEESCNQRRGEGWSAHQMFSANSALGVKSTFDENLSQYTTANIEGDEQARANAERIAMEIEKSAISRMRSQIENDDEERDLDKETPEFHVASHRRTTAGTGRGGFCGNIRGGLGPNRGSGQLAGRRGDGISGAGRGGRGGGSYSSSGSTSRSFTNSSLSHGGRGGTASSTGGYGVGSNRTYPPERPSAQSVRNQFDQWESSQGTGKSAAASASTGSKALPRRSETIPGGTTSVFGAKIFESSHRAAARHSNQSPSNRLCDETKFVLNGSTTSSSLPSGGGGRGGQVRRLENLREFQQNFNSIYQSATTHGLPRATVNEEQRSGVALATVATNRSAMSNAWHKGPPASIVRTQPTPSHAGHAQHSKSCNKEPETSTTTVMQGRSEAVSLKPKDVPHPVSSVSVTAGAAVTCTAAGTPAPPDASPSPSASRGCRPGIPSSPPTRDPVRNVISAAASSSSIAPVDPTPSGASVETNAIITPSSLKKKFEFNPNAPPFTPRTRSPQMQQQSVYNSAAVAAPVPVPLPIANPQNVTALPPAGFVASPAPAQYVQYPQANPYIYIPTAGAAALPPAAVAMTSVTAASVAGGPIVANTSGVATARSAHLGQVASVARRSQQQMAISSTGMYMPGVTAGQSLTPQMINAQYTQVTPYYQPAYSQIPPMPSANMPPPTLPPPPTTNTVPVAAPPSCGYSVISAQGHYPGTYTRPTIYQPGQTVVPRFTQAHPAAEYNAATVASNHQAVVTVTQQASSATSSNGSNGHNSQPATPGPLTSPQVTVQQQPQAQQQHYPTIGTPQSPHPYLVSYAMSAASNPTQTVFVQPPQFSYVPSYVCAPHQYVPVPHQSNIVTASNVPYTQAQSGQQISQQHAPAEQYHGGNEQTQTTVLQHPSYGAAIDPNYVQYAHVHQHQQAAAIYQQAAAIARQNSLGGGNGLHTTATHPFQAVVPPSAIASASSSS